ncbi:MAG: Pr6Pr family membrane protein [Roseburia sp.]
MSTREKTKINLLPAILKVIAIAASIYGMIISYENLGFFTYFTNLSNIAIDLGLLASLIYDLVGKEKKNGFYVVKFLLTLSITLTFLVYLCILAPTSEDGFMAAYFNNYAASFCVHFITPVLAIVDFLLFDYRYESTPAHAIYAVIPPLVYVGYVLILGQCFGVRWSDGNMMAPYNFINYGAPTGWFGFDLSQADSYSLGVGVAYMIVALLILFILLGELFLFGKNLRKKCMQGK